VLRAKRDAAEANHQHMKAANAAIRRCAGQGRDAQLAALLELGIEKIAADALLVPFHADRMAGAVRLSGDIRDGLK
jgi:hypothetical protein